ncbi:MAG: RNA recognition motif domain-containing protein [Flavobacteriia bacterium]|jgi:RNA recognition motif-containing protein
MVNIFIANLDWEITSEDLKTTFSAFGTVTYAHVVFDKETKRSKGYGYIEMDNTDHAINAIEALNGMEINGRKLDVKIASPKGNRPPKKEATPKKPSGFKKPFNRENRNDAHQGHGRSGGNKTGGSFRGGNQGGGSFNRPNKDQ